MKAPFFGKKNICKKPKIPPRKKDISFDRYKKRINTEVPEDLESRNSAPAVMRMTSFPSSE